MYLLILTVIRNLQIQGKLFKLELNATSISGEKSVFEGHSENQAAIFEQWVDENAAEYLSEDEMKALKEQVSTMIAGVDELNAQEGYRGTSFEAQLRFVTNTASGMGLNIAYHANDPGAGMSLAKDTSRYKLFASDVGLFVTLAFKDKDYTENVIYNKLLSDKLDANLGYVYENVVAQILLAKGNNLFYYTIKSDTSHHLYEIDFLISQGDKISPIEVKSGNYQSHRSLDVFCDKFSSRIRDKYVVHTKDYKWEKGIHYIPVYMLPFI